MSLWGKENIGGYAQHTVGEATFVDTSPTAIVFDHQRRSRLIFAIPFPQPDTHKTDEKQDPKTHHFQRHTIGTRFDASARYGWGYNVTRLMCRSRRTWSNTWRGWFGRSRSRSRSWTGRRTGTWFLGRGWRRTGTRRRSRCR